MEFDYFKKMEAVEEQICSIPNYEEYEENLFVRYYDLVERFFKLFESIIRYKSDLDTLLREVEGQSYIESVESLL
jgi:hypothetical protein